MALACVYFISSFPIQTNQSKQMILKLDICLNNCMNVAVHNILLAKQKHAALRSNFQSAN